MKRVIIAAVSLIITIGFASPSNATLLGVAGDYNAFIFGDMATQATDSQGRVAVGGNFTSTHFTVADSLILPSSQYSLVSGGNVDYQSATMLNGGIFAAGNIYLDHHTVNGDVTANGTVTLGSGGGTITGSTNASAGATSPINFSDERSYLLGLSSGPSGLPSMVANGTTNVVTYATGSQITLTAGSDPVNFFNLQGSALNNATNFNLNFGANQVAIINVSGESIDLSGFGPTGWEGKQQNILFNFYEATSLSIHNIGWKGSILAPLAGTAFYSAHIDGTLIANSLTWENAAGSAGGEYHWYPFDNDLDVEITSSAPEPVPEPATMLLFGTGLVGLATRLRKKSQKASS